MRIAIIVFMVLMLVGAAAAVNGNKFNENCFAKPEGGISEYATGYCNGYIVGVQNAVDVFQGTLDAKDKPVVKSAACVPQDVTSRQMFLVVKKYFADNPDKLNWAASVLILNAFIKAFPCK